MELLRIEEVVKRFHNQTAVDKVSFSVKKGLIFGLLGPNGAGKTTLIRMITTITKPDSGNIILEGNNLDEIDPRQIGYMPEERGLYKKMKVGEQLIYLAELRGLDRKSAVANVKDWMTKFEIESWWNKKISELSKGMGQKVQFISTVAHKPPLIILDEPFSGLDPINTNLIKDEIYKLKQQGASIIFSTHRMEQVEELCDEIVLMNKGEILLNGSVKDIKNSYRNYTYNVIFSGDLPDDLTLDKLQIIDKKRDSLTIQGDIHTSTNEILQVLIKNGVQIIQFNEILPSLNEIFIKKVETDHA